MDSTETKISMMEVTRYLTIARSLKGKHKFYDMHVHPFEIVFNKCAYQENKINSGLYSTNSSTFSAPILTELIVMNQGDKKSNSKLFQRPLIFRMKFTALYTHSGPKVFNAQRNLSTIDKMLLLPVAQVEGNVEPQMKEMKKMYASDKKFFFGWSVSNNIRDEDIYRSACSAKKLYNICAIKQNLTQSEINIATVKGRRRLEHILETCAKSNLPLIIHSGKSPLAKDKKIGRYSVIEVLEKFDWGDFSCPVVFAHSAAYNYSPKDVKEHVIPRLKKLISANKNLFIDISGVDVLSLKYILNKIPTERILFGSDALYEHQWQRVVKLLHALERSSKKFEESFIKIMSFNPERNIFKDKRHFH